MKYNKKRFFPKKDKYKKDEGMTVTVRNNDVNGALRVLRKRLVKEGIIQELREKTYFPSRGEKRRKEKAAAIRRYKRKLQKELEERL